MNRFPSLASWGLDLVMPPGSLLEVSKNVALRPFISELKMFKQNPERMTFRQKLDLILENKVVQKFRD